MTTVTGSLYDARTGAKVTSGALFLTPTNFIRFGDDVVAPYTISYDIPGTGNISLSLVPSNGVPYDVEFDPDPADTATPRSMKSGFFVDSWTIPSSGPVDIASL